MTDKPEINRLISCEYVIETRWLGNGNDINEMFQKCRNLPKELRDDLHGYQKNF